MGKDDGAWFYGNWAFTKDPKGKPFLFVEWVRFDNDGDHPTDRKLDVVEAWE